MNRTPMNNPDQHDWLDKALSGANDIQHSYIDQYINDGGFTENVMRRLPPRRQQTKSHTIILGCAGLLSVATFLLTAPDPAALYADFIDFLYAQSVFNLCALATPLYAATGAIAYWIFNPEK
jgi:hypothetical protein